MGLDGDLVKIDKAHYDKHCGQGIFGKGRKRLDYYDGCEVRKVLFYYRKWYEVKDMIDEVLGGHCDQTTFYHLTQEELRSFRPRSVEMELEDPDKMAEFLKNVDQILEETNFETHVICFTWISYGR